MKLVFFGDSICYGYGAAPGTSFIERIAQDLKPKGIQVINSGVNGDTTADALRRLNKDLINHKPDLVYLQFGFNDASWWAGQVGKPWVKLDDFLHNLQTMILGAKSAGAKTIILATNHPSALDSSFFDAHSAATYAKTLSQYNQAIRDKFANYPDLIFLDVELAAKKSTETLVCNDGVHLNLAGNNFYYKLILACLSQYI